MSADNKPQDHVFYRKYGKRFLDIVLSGCALVALSPALIAIAILVRVYHGSPIFFTPTRPGKDERIFRLMKFRTMTDARDADGVLLPEEERLTGLGKFLRATSLDEIPELINIFIGDMSIVGPRPFAMKYLPYYNDSERRRHSVRPGLTGLAQIRGRNNLLWPQRFEKDMEYIDELSFSKDLAIVIGTIGKLFGDSDVTIPDAKRMPQFDTYRLLQEEGEPVDPSWHTGHREVGGCFWLDEGNCAVEGKKSAAWLPTLSDGTYTFSGRSALALALQDAAAAGEIRTACVPSYLPFSALQPFIQAGISYRFYDVELIDGRIRYQLDADMPCDLLFVVDYFGTDRQEMQELARQFKNRGGTVIQDFTHSLFSTEPIFDASDYAVASLRKWLPIPTGGWLTKRGGKLCARPDQDGASAAAKSEAAMREKYQYICGAASDKTDYLEKAAGFESDLVQLNPRLAIDDLSKTIAESTDTKKLTTVRRSNALYLYDNLNGLDFLHFLHSREELERITPYVVPVLLKPDDRNSLREYLCSRGFYCPIHWPERMGAKMSFRNLELSLVCDQRYSEVDMADLVRAIRSWHEELSAGT
jgi:lipopolysaccharide/colanic/teichoic acid biosynthesis glycosyltransferase